MAASFKDNAYHILGLTGTASAKQILQRSNEIIQRLKIDDETEYDLDIPGIKARRTEELTKDALRRLQAPKTRLQEYFFWFRIADDIDKSAASHLARKEFDQAAAIWGATTDERNPGAFTHSRNLALAQTLSLFEPAPDGPIEASLAAWSALLDSQKFWVAFVQDYRRDAEALSDETIAEFRSKVTSDLSDLYAEIQETRGSGDFVYRFQQRFSARGKKVEEKILNPVLKGVQTTIEQLERLKFDDQINHNTAKTAQLKGPVAALQAELNKLIEAGLYEDSAAQRRHCATSSSKSTTIATTWKPRRSCWSLPSRSPAPTASRRSSRASRSRSPPTNRTRKATRSRSRFPARSGVARSSSSPTT
ncbi:MAG: hypothetical protein HYX63_03990 [Gammaproteobacteria bacterium]|nr:hypothetical protein [Gammaproteobacteria bacterium]